MSAECRVLSARVPRQERHVVAPLIPSIPQDERERMLSARPYEGALSMNSVMAATYSCGWVRCGRWPSPSRVLRVAFGRTAPSLSSTGAKKGGLSEPPPRSTGRSKRDSTFKSISRASGSRVSSRNVGALLMSVRFASSGRKVSQAPGPRIISTKRRAPSSMFPAASSLTKGRMPASSSSANGSVAGSLRKRVEKGQLMDDERADQLGTLGGEAEGDRGAHGVAEDVRGRSGAFDDRCEVGDVFADAALRWEALALAVAAAVVDDDAEALGEAGQDKGPLVVIDPGTVDEDERLAGPELLDEDLDAIDCLDGHDDLRWGIIRGLAR